MTPTRITCTACHGHGKETSPTGKMHECRACDGFGYTKGPTRITLSRAKGWQKPAGAIVVARPSIWGNPWGIGTPGTIDLVLDGVKTRYKVKDFIDQPFAVALFGLWVEGGTIPDDYLPEVTLTTTGAQMMRYHLHARRQLILANLDQLRGHELCCWCKQGQPCHGDVLLRLANGGGE